MKPLEYDARALDPKRVYSDVMSSGVAVIHGVMPEAVATSAAHAAMEWTKTEPAFDTKGGTASPAPGQNLHRVDNDPALSKTKHIFHTFNFENLNGLPSPYREPIVQMFERLLALDNELCGKRGDFTGNGIPNFRPQIIHYPVGGGYFERHTHNLEPQKIGLIATLVKTGSGGTKFWVNGDEIDAEPAQSIGSVTLFRFDLPHSVSAVEPGSPLAFGEATGRWVAVLPYR